MPQPVTVILNSASGSGDANLTSRQVDHFESFQTKAVSIDALRKHLTVSLDGELALVWTPIHFRILPAALRVLVPESEAA